MEIKLKENASFIIKDSTGANAFKVQESAIKTTWVQLKEARDAGKLSPGLSYRITDYICTTSNNLTTANSTSDFDIIVTALDESHLSEEAKACVKEPNTDDRMSSWKIWYSLDNDIRRFSWAKSKYIYSHMSSSPTTSKDIFYFDRKLSSGAYPYRWRYGTSPTSTTYVYTASDNPTTDDKAYDSSSTGANSKTIWSVSLDEGKGVIYRMIDSCFNDCPYDFKNIKFFNSNIIYINFSGNYTHYLVKYVGPETRNQTTYHKYSFNYINDYWNRKINLYFTTLNPAINDIPSIVELLGDWSEYSGPTNTNPSSYKVEKYILKPNPNGNLTSYVYTFGNTTDYSKESVVGHRIFHENRIYPSYRSIESNSIEHEGSKIYLPFNLFYINTSGSYTGSVTMYKNTILGTANIIESVAGYNFSGYNSNINLTGNSNYLVNSQKITIFGNYIKIPNFAQNIIIHPECENITFTSSSSTWDYSNKLQNIIIYSGIKNKTLDIETNNSFLTEVKPDNSVIKLV